MFEDTYTFEISLKLQAHSSLGTCTALRNVLVFQKIGEEVICCIQEARYSEEVIALMSRLYSCPDKSGTGQLKIVQWP